jgi:hypothetical protein
MDRDVKQKLAPVRAKGRPATTDRKEEEAWAETCDWRNSEQDLTRIIRRIIARLDSTYREEYGVRLDQIAEDAELLMSSSQSADWYRHAEPRYRQAGIYSHLYSGLDNLLRKRAHRLVDQRRKRGDT